MNIYLISYGDFDYDGRLRELCKVFSSMGELSCITRGSVGQGPRHRIYRGNYPGFIAAALQYGRRLGKIDLLVLDNRKAVLPGLLLRMMKKPGKMIQDCRELYDIRSVHFVGKVGCIIEKWGINRADILIAANRERAEIMKETFRLSRMPVVYENLRQLEYSCEDARARQESRFAPYIHDGEIRIVSSSGCSLSRGNDVLVKNLGRVDGKCRLFLVGAASAKERSAIEAIVAEQKLKNVEIFEQLNQDELKYLISVSHIGIVNYHQNDLNNKLCASGKVYEFMYEGIPVVTTTNPPLKRMCDEYRIGYADDGYCDGINRVVADYDRYQADVRRFAAENPVDANNVRLQQDLTELLHTLSAGT